MDAVISARAGVALLLDGDELSSIHADSIDERVPRRAADLHFLFGDVTDLEFIEDVDPVQTARQLERAVDSEEALHLVLMLLDPEMPVDIRQEAAEVLEELFTKECHDTGVAQHLERVLYAQVLHASADLERAFDCCERGSAPSVRDLLKRLEEIQPFVRLVRRAWEAIPTQTFGSEEDWSHAQAVLVREGLFRDLVLNRAGGERVDTFLLNGWLNPKIDALKNSRAILDQWVAPFPRESSPKPRFPRSEGDTELTTMEN